MVEEGIKGYYLIKKLKHFIIISLCSKWTILKSTSFKKYWNFAADSDWTPVDCIYFLETERTFPRNWITDLRSGSWWPGFYKDQIYWPTRKICEERFFCFNLSFLKKKKKTSYSQSWYFLQILSAVDFASTGGDHMFSYLPGRLDEGHSATEHVMNLKQCSFAWNIKVDPVR